jgi:hypothetical protein
MRAAFKLDPRCSDSPRPNDADLRDQSLFFHVLSESTNLSARRDARQW